MYTWPYKEKLKPCPDPTELWIELVQISVELHDYDYSQVQYHSVMVRMIPAELCNDLQF